MKNSPPNFNKSKTTDETSSNFKKSSKKVKFDKSVEIQQLTFKEEREHQKRIKAELDEKLMAERTEQLKMDEMYRKINGIPFEGKFVSFFSLKILIFFIFRIHQFQWIHFNKILMLKLLEILHLFLFFQIKFNVW